VSTQDKQKKEADLSANKDKLISYIRQNIIGSNIDTLLRTVFGEKPHLYVDYTASGKSLRFIEDYMQRVIMPLYANTHSMQSASGKQTIYAREEARAIIKRVCNADENDACIFVGSGATSASNLLINKLKLKKICENVLLRNKRKEDGQNELEDEKTEEENYLKQNRWHSYDCTLCKVIVPS
jgi:selenocysteine lyase/cysteine desulfurase